jgi:hypothetical protein
MKIISQRHTEEHVEYCRDFRWRTCLSAGFSFPCDPLGNLLVEPPPSEVALANRAACLSGAYDVVDRGVNEVRWSYRVPAVGLCDDCGAEVQLDGFTCTCESCGADYNMGGQRLAPREQWELDTGESVSDILRCDRHYRDESHDYDHEGD